MDIKITYNSLKKFLETEATAEEIAAKVSLCGPTFDRIHKQGNDYIFEIEAITNRIDTASVQGVARETVAILNQFDVTSKMINDPYTIKTEFDQTQPSNFKIDVETPELTPRFMAISLGNVKISESPKDTIDFLEKCGERSINNAVDITNELTHLYGMPSHIFDLDKIAGKYLHIRKSKTGETLTTLDDTDNKLAGNDIIIEDNSKKIIDLCGIMGGKEAVVDINTTNILLIVPTYHPKLIRKSSLYLQKRTLASQIYEKQPDTELCLPTIYSAIKLFQERTGAVITSSLFDYYPQKLSPKIIELDLNWLSNFVGKEIEPERVITILDDLGFGGSVKNNILFCTVPSFRYYDINIKEDIAEEVARIYGYFRLPSILPSVNLPPQELSQVLTNELKTKKYLANLGYSEVYNNSLISLDLITKTISKEENHLKLTNALSSDYEYLRTSLLPSLINNYKNNLGKIDGPINIFELSNTYKKRKTGKVPDEIPTLGMISGDSYTKVKGILESLFEYLNITNVEFTIPKSSPLQIFDSNKTASIYHRDTVIGHIGALSPVIANNYGITKDISILEIDFNKLVGCINNNYLYTPISNYPNMIEDITITSNSPVGEIITKIKDCSELITKVNYLSSFKNKHTFKLIFSSQENDLDQTKINIIKEIISNTLNTKE